MELIPILSTIILVATISTFLLAIGAYILYKIRESKGLRSAAPEPAAVRAELYTPAEAPAQTPVQVPKPGPEIAPHPVYYQPAPAVEGKFQKYTSEGYVEPVNEKKSRESVKWK